MHGFVLRNFGEVIFVKLYAQGFWLNDEIFFSCSICKGTLFSSRMSSYAEIFGCDSFGRLRPPTMFGVKFRFSEKAAKIWCILPQGQDVSNVQTRYQTYRDYQINKRNIKTLLLRLWVQQLKYIGYYGLHKHFFLVLLLKIKDFFHSYAWLVNICLESQFFHFDQKQQTLIGGQKVKFIFTQFLHDLCLTQKSGTYFLQTFQPNHSPTSTERFGGSTTFLCQTKMVQTLQCTVLKTNGLQKKFVLLRNSFAQ